MDTEELDQGNQEKEDDEVPVVHEWLEHVEVITTDLSAVDHVEKLQKDKGVENVGQMTSLGLRLLINDVWCIIVLWVLKFKSSWHSNQGGYSSRIFRETSSPSSEEHDQDNHKGVEQRDSNNLSPNSWGHQWVLFLEWFAVNHRLHWRFSRQSESGKQVHDNIDPQELHRSNWLLTEHDDTNEDHDQARDVNCYLELQESLDVLVNVSSPHDSSKKCFEVIIDQDQVRWRLGCSNTRSHGNSNRWLSDSSDIIDTVTSGSNLQIKTEKSKNECLLILSSWSGHYPQVMDDLLKLCSVTVVFSFSKEILHKLHCQIGFSWYSTIASKQFSSEFLSCHHWGWLA